MQNWGNGGPSIAFSSRDILSGPLVRFPVVLFQPLAAVDHRTTPAVRRAGNDHANMSLHAPGPTAERTMRSRAEARYRPALNAASVTRQHFK